jgi:hypothetical protein
LPQKGATKRKKDEFLPGLSGVTDRRESLFARPLVLSAARMKSSETAGQEIFDELPAPPDAARMESGAIGCGTALFVEPDILGYYNIINLTFLVCAEGCGGLATVAAV